MKVNNMLKDNDKFKLMETASILRLISRDYYDVHKHLGDSENQHDKDSAFKAYEKYSELNRIAREIDMIAAGNL